MSAIPLNGHILYKHKALADSLRKDLQDWLATETEESKWAGAPPGRSSRRSDYEEGFVMLALVLGLFVVAAEAKTEVPVLVRQLGADTYGQREAASAALARIRAPALVELRSACSDDAEVRLRARRLVDAIEKLIFLEFRQFAGHSGSVNGVAFSPDGNASSRPTTVPSGCGTWQWANNSLASRSTTTG